MGNNNTTPSEYITSLMPRICGGSAPVTDINNELQTHKQKRMKSKKSMHNNNYHKTRRKISPNKAKRIKKQLQSTIKSSRSHNKNKYSNNHLYLKEESELESLTYHEGYVTASTASTRSNTIVTSNYNKRLSTYPPPLWKQSASIPEVDRYRDEARIILDRLRTEKERESGEHWLDKYELDTLYIRNDLNYKWTICKIIQMNDASVCIYNDMKNQYEWIDKRSSKIKPHPSYDMDNDDHETQNQNKNKYQIKSQSPPIIPMLHPDKILYYYDAIMNREYIICCTEYDTFNDEYEAGIYKYDINYNKLEYLTKYLIAPKNYFKATMDHRNEQLHIYCFPHWSILDLKTLKWNVTSISDSVKYNLINIQASASIIVHGLLYIFGNGRFAKFDKSLMMFKEIGFPGIENKYIWEVNNVMYVRELNRIYIFGLCDSYPSFERMWYTAIYYMDVNDKKLIKWKKLKLSLPYYTYGVFSDYYVVHGFKYFLFVFYYKLNELWIFDLLCNKRFKYNKSIHIELAEYCKIIINDNNIMHSLCLDHNGPIHIKLSLQQLLKNLLQEYLLKLKADLICGYIKRNINIPLSCKTIIFNYYPQMVDIE